MAFYVSWLAKAAYAATAGTNMRVYEQAGWTSRGHGGMAMVEGVVGHHTGTPASSPGDYPSLNTIIHGRSDLPGPLSAYGLGRGGHIYVIASGLSYHAGSSSFAGFTDLNGKFLGIEAESPGDGHWTPEQLFMYPRLVGEILRHAGRGVDRYCSHRTCATPTGRKPDPTGIDDNWMRNQAAAYLRGEQDMAVTKQEMADIAATLLEMQLGDQHVTLLEMITSYWNGNKSAFMDKDSFLLSKIAHLETQLAELTELVRALGGGPVELVPTGSISFELKENQP